MVPARAAAFLLLVLPLPGFGGGDSDVVGGSDDGLAETDALTGLRRRFRHCANEPPGQQSPVVGVATVEPEHELVKVLIEMVTFDRALVGAENPSFQQRRHPMHVRQVDVRWLRLIVEWGCLMAVVAPFVGGLVDGNLVRGQTVSEKIRARFDVCLDERIGCPSST